MPAELRQTGIEALGAMPWGVPFLPFLRNQTRPARHYSPVFQSRPWSQWILLVDHLGVAEPRGSHRSIAKIDSRSGQARRGSKHGNPCGQVKTSNTTPAARLESRGDETTRALGW